MGYYDDLIGKRVVERTLTYKGQTRKVYFRPLTAGERVQLSRGQRMTLGNDKGDGARANMDVDAGDLLARTHKLVAFTNVTVDGKQIFKNEREVADLPEDFVSELANLAQDVIGDEDEGGNVPPGES